MQGVGFRPFVVRLANELALSGSVSNSSSGVTIEVEGENANIFKERIKLEKPKMAVISSFECSEIELKNDCSFQILKSEESGKVIAFLPQDFSICKECESELFNSSNRRYLYPFISCTDCGARYSLIKSLPFDKQTCSMDEFNLCEDCAKEYKNPQNRRFHAQTICCEKCGPKLSANIKDFAVKIKNGEVCAIKGVGGYNFICDASNENAVAKLREIKKRPHKPLAVMFKDINTLKTYTNLSANEEGAILSIQKPIVLVQKSDKSLAKNIAFDSKMLGVFLPYSALHQLIINEVDLPIVVTSANLSSEPIITNDSDFKARFENVFLLTHNRQIIATSDDSVVRVDSRGEFFLRTGRGFAPKYTKLNKKFSEPVLCVGGHQKNTISLGIEDFVVTSPYIADLDNLASIERFEQTIEHFCKIYKVEPKIVVCDAHPKYASSVFANSLNAKIYKLQHHKAHFYAAIAESGMIEKDCMGAVWDGTGYGDDGNIWGGEFFIYKNGVAKHVAQIEPFYLLGGERAAKEPRLCALSILFELYGKDALNLDLPTIKAFTQSELEMLWLAYEKKLNVIKTSSVGRLFDAVASILGVLQISQYEGQSGLLLEQLYEKSNSFNAKTPKEIIKCLTQEQNINKAIGGFLATLCNILFENAKEYNLPIVASGGVFLNSALRELCYEESKNYGLDFYAHTSPNDESISLGQAVFASIIL